MKPINVIIFSAVAILLVLGSFIVGVIYADKTSLIPKQGNFEIEASFSDIQKTDLTLFDGEYPYFTNGTGANKQEAADYKANPENYEEYTVVLTVKNKSNYDIPTVWAVSLGYQADYEKVTLKQGETNPSRNVWINCWLNTGVTSLRKGETLITNVRLIVKRNGADDKKGEEIIMNTQINLQLAVSTKSINSNYDISRDIYFNYPVFYKD